MTTSQAVEDAVALLRSRLGEARHELSRLSTEIQQIEGALQRLGYGDESRGAERWTESVATAEPNSPMFSEAMPISAAVRVLIDAEKGPWTPRAVARRLEAGPINFKKQRTDDQFLSAIGAAFYNLRKRGHVVTDQYNQTRSTKWVRDAEAPVAAGASDGEESEEGSSGKKGGTVNGTAPPVGRDHGSGDADRDHGHGDRASIGMEALAL